MFDDLFHFQRSHVVAGALPANGSTEYHRRANAGNNEGSLRRAVTTTVHHVSAVNPPRGRLRYVGTGSGARPVSWTEGKHRYRGRSMISRRGADNAKNVFVPSAGVPWCLGVLKSNTFEILRSPWFFSHVLTVCAMYSTILCKKFASSSAIRDLSRSLNVDVVGVLCKSHPFVTNRARLFSHNRVADPDRPSSSSFLRAGSATVADRKYYCKEYRPFPEVPEFPPVVWPNLFKSIKALLYTYLIIKPQFDKDFSLQEFSKNSRLVMYLVSPVFWRYRHGSCCRCCCCNAVLYHSHRPSA